MNTNRAFTWTRIRNRVCAWWRAFHPKHDEQQHDGNEYQLFSSMPKQTKKERRGQSSREYVSHLQAQIGVSPTEGHELTQDLHLTKCRSHGGGAPRSTTGFGRHPIQINLSEVCDEREDQDPTEVVREIGRSAIRDIRAKTEKR